jgi:hypothetical protein
VFTGRVEAERRPKTRWASLVVLVVGLVLASAAAWWVVRERYVPPEPPKAAPPAPAPAPKPAGPVRSDAEAANVLRRYLVATKAIGSECVAILGHGRSGGQWTLSASDRCQHVRLGRFRVDAQTGAVTPMRR